MSKITRVSLKSGSQTINLSPRISQEGNSTPASWKVSNGPLLGARSLRALVTRKGKNPTYTALEAAYDLPTLGADGKLHHRSKVFINAIVSDLASNAERQELVDVVGQLFKPAVTTGPSAIGVMPDTDYDHYTWPEADFLTFVDVSGGISSAQVRAIYSPTPHALNGTLIDWDVTMSKDIFIHPTRDSNAFNAVSSHLTLVEAHTTTDGVISAPTANPDDETFDFTTLITELEPAY